MSIRIENSQTQHHPEEMTDAGSAAKQAAAQPTARRHRPGQAPGAAPSTAEPEPEGKQPLVEGQQKKHRSAVAAYASYERVKRALEQDPAQADRFIDERLRGSSDVDRSIVMRTVAERGNTGLRKYADAEEVLRTLSSFAKEERRDILGILKAGARFGDAVKQERAELKAPVRFEAQTPRASTAGLQKQALANVRARAAKVNELGVHVKNLLHEIGKIDRKAEVVAGVGSAVGLVGAGAVAPLEARIKGTTKPIREVVERADAAGGLVAGELSKEIAQANATAEKFFGAAGAFIDAQSLFETAVRERDYAGMVAQSKAMDAAAKEMKLQAGALGNQAKVIAKWNRKLEHALFDTALQAVLIGVSGHHEIAVSAKGIAAAIVQEGARERVVEGAIRAASERH